MKRMHQLNVVGPLTLVLAAITLLGLVAFSGRQATAHAGGAAPYTALYEDGTPHPEATETERPEATETEHPQTTETEHPEATGTAHPEATETEHPQATETAHPERTETPEAGLTVPGAASRVFPQTGRTVGGVFLAYWDDHGGLAQQGFPISGLRREVSPLDGKSYVVQYFERAVFEYHPGNQAPFQVLLAQLGTFQYRLKYPAGAPNQHAHQDNGRYFAETGHWVGGQFRTYWQQHGGLAQQGYPISEEFTEVSPLDGKPYIVQYFERAVFEDHPGNQAPFQVLLSQLGTFRYHEMSAP